jgi:hypothetical protein
LGHRGQAPTAESSLVQRTGEREDEPELRFIAHLDGRSLLDQLADGRGYRPQCGRTSSGGAAGAARRRSRRAAACRRWKGIRSPCRS